MKQHIDKHGSDGSAAPVPRRSDPERRRSFLRTGLAAGSALTALTARPVRTLANNRACTYSAATSTMNSHAPTQTCKGGKGPAHWKGASNWPKSFTIPPSTTKRTFESKFSDIFGGSVNNTLDNIMNHQSGIPEFHWVTALANALMSVQLGLNFPYTAQQVVSFYNNPSLIDPTASPPPTRTSIVNFFINNFENL